MSEDEVKIIDSLIKTSEQELFMNSLKERFLQRERLVGKNQRAVDQTLAGIQGQVKYLEKWSKFLAQVKTGQI